MDLKLFGLIKKKLDDIGINLWAITIAKNIQKFKKRLFVKPQDISDSNTFECVFYLRIHLFNLHYAFNFIKTFTSLSKSRIIIYILQLYLYPLPHLLIERVSCEVELALKGLAVFSPDAHAVSSTGINFHWNKKQPPRIRSVHRVELSPGPVSLSCWDNKIVFFSASNRRRVRLHHQALSSSW